MIHSRRFIAAAIAAAFIVSPLSGRAQEKEHAHKSPHGGMVITSGKYHYEMVVDHKHKAAHIYLLDDKEKTMPLKDITGKATFLFPDKSKKEVTLAMHEDHFEAPIDSTKLDNFTAVVTLKIAGKSQIGRFTHKAGMKEEHHEAGEHHEKGEHPSEHPKEKPKKP